MQTLEFQAMGCRMMAASGSDESNAIERLTEVPQLFAEWEQTLSRFRVDSELVRLNQQAGHLVPVSLTLWLVIQEALTAARLSGGRVVPHLLPVLEAAGYDRSFEQLQPVPAMVNTSATVDADAWQAIALYSRTRAVRLPTGMRLDLGGIAKGWAADQALQWLGRMGPALVDAGGDIAVGEPPIDGPGWPVAIGDPRQPGQQLGLMKLARVGVATSGRDYRKWQRAGRTYHHILDPHTGLPAETDVLSATVVAPTARWAEMAAKTVLILGSEFGLEWLETQSELAGFLVLDDGSQLLSRGMTKYFWSS
jgi:thiamine biosynthesis lipoprotein